MSTKITRKPRSDKGRVLPTSRDYELMRIIGTFGGLYLDSFCFELGKFRDGKALTKWHHRPASARTASDVIERLAKLHFVEMKKFELGKPPFIWATTPGLRFADLPYTYWQPRSIDATYHPHGVYCVWHYIESRYIVHWLRTHRALEHYEPEREHIPDIEARITYETLTQTVAIEYERTHKAAPRYDKILPYLVNNYDTTFYFVEPEAWTAVEKAIARLPDEKRDRIKMKSMTGL
jgi:hypothetical protein